MKRLFGLFILLAFIGCTEVSVEKTLVVADKEFYATIENEDSRTYVNDQFRLRWTAGDCITVFKKTTYPRKFQFDGATGDNSGGFQQISTDDEIYSGSPVSVNCAVYPHSEETMLDETDLFITLTLPDQQTYVENSFGLGANTMVAVSEDNQLTFKNVGSFLRVRLYGEDVEISSIVISSKGNEAIAGEAKVTPALDGNPTCEMTGTEKSIRLTCTASVLISTDVSAPTDFWITLPPVTLSNGFSVTVTNSEGNTQTYDVEKSVTFERNVFYNLTREVTIKPETPYVTFSAAEEQTLTMSRAVNTLEYSVDGDEWEELETKTITFGGVYGNLQLRGKNANGTGNDDVYSTIKFGNSTPVACSGDIRTLIDYENYTTVDTGNAMFYHLFAKCTNLTSAPKLPATKLSRVCYTGMFSGCSSLKVAPELPATTLAIDCYYYMFSGCSSLEVAPELPATSLVPYCYGGMFSGCSSLKTTPELPATILAKGCYKNMFSGCSSLTTAPELPVTTLALYCYQGMFDGCSNLTVAPELPATTLTSSCYEEMFANCTNLAKSPDLSATTLATSCYQNMFSNCTSLAKAPKLPALQLKKNCYTAMFDGCSGLAAAPKLPATTLADYCYSSMFKNCTKITIAPELPAGTLTEYCYQRMFYGCSNLNRVTMLATNIDGTNCLSEWLYGVASSGIFTKAKDMQSLPKGTSGIPTKWSTVNYEE